MPKRFFTIGYEHTTQAGLIAALTANKVKTLVDPRGIANSRRAGFSKKLLAASLDEAGITYIYLRALGTLKAGRIANRAGRTEEFRAIDEAGFQQAEAQFALVEAEELCRAASTALICYCSDGEKCHRNRIAEALEEKGLKGKEILFRA